MAADVWLQVAMESNATDSPVDFRFSVDEQWLRQHTQGDLEGDSAHVRLNADGPQIEDWRGVGQIPFFRAFGGEVQLDTVLFDDVDWQGYIKLQLSGYGPIHKVGDGTEFADYCCHLHSGAVTVWTLEGFDSERDFFHWTGAADGDFDQWRCQIWPQPQAQLAAIRFGARAIQIDVQDASGRSRSVLVAERTDNRLWKLDDCDAHENLRAPRQVIGDLRQRITNSLQAAHWDTQSGIPGNKWIFVSDRLALLDPTPPEVYSRAPRSKTPTEVLQLLRPNFDISFSDGSKESRWSPAMASITEPNIELHDADRIAAEIHQVPVQNDPVPVLGLKWRGDGQVPTLVDGTLPPAPCVGVSTGEVQGGYIWQYGNTNVVPAGAPHRPALIRYSVPLDSRPAEVVPLPESVDGPLPIARGAMPDGWQLAISPTVPPRAPAYAKTISLMISTDATHNVELRCFSGTWSADSPRLLMLVTSLADPASPPNAALLSPTDQRSDPFAPTSLSFTSAVGDSIDAGAVLQLETSGANPALIVHASKNGSVSESVQVFWPHAPAALIDPVPAAARNLRQSRDLVSLRTIVERDFSHGTTTWEIATFRLRSDAQILSRAGGDRMAMLDGITGLGPTRSQLHSAMALLPWVACRDQLGGARSQQLHHRNLVLEPGEFAAASQDRSVDGRPMAFANTERDFLEAVRDPFTLAVADLPVAPAPATEIVQWLPGASVATSPSARMVGGTITADLRDRFPSVVLQDGLGQPTPQTLNVLYRDGSKPPDHEPTDWLTYNLRRAGWNLTSTPPKPKIDLSVADTATENRWRRARNVSVPPLFDDATVSGAFAETLPATASAPQATWVCFGDGQGRIVVADLARPTSKQFLRGGDQQARSGIQMAIVTAISATRWLVAVDGQGESFVWKSDGDLPSLTLVNNALPSMGVTAVGAACQANGLIAFVAVNPAGGTAKLVIWDPTSATGTTNPVIIATLPQVTAANVLAVSLVADGGDLILAVAHSNSPAVVLRGTLQTGTWQFTPLTFATLVTARLVGAKVISGGVLIVTVEGDKDLKVWTSNGSTLSTDGNTAMTAPAAVTAVAIGAWPADAWLRPQPPNVTAMLYLATTAAITGWLVLKNSATAPFRQLAGANGPVDRLVAVDLATAAMGERLPLVSRPHLLAYGSEGTCRLWDVDAEQAYAPIADHQDVYDNAGTIRTARPGTRISPIAYGEWVNRPGSAAAKRSDPASQYAPANTIIEYSSVPVDPADALIHSATDPEAVTEIFLMCDRLRLCLQGDTWTPEAFAGEPDPRPDRPQLPFPFHRGPVGGYGMYSFVEGETEDLNYYPRLAGLPIYPTRLNYMKFGQTNGVTDFSDVEEIQFEAALVNPLEVSRRELKSIEYTLDDLGVGKSPPVTLLLSAVTPIRVSGVFIEPHGTATGVDPSNTSVWRLVNGSAILVEKTFGSAPFPANHVQFDLGALTSPAAVNEGRLELVVVNGATVDLPAVTVTIEYYQTQPRIPPFVYQAIQDQSLIRVRLKRNASGMMQVDKVQPFDRPITWALPATESPVVGDEELDGRLAQFTADVSYEPFVLPRIGGHVQSGRLVLKAFPPRCVVELLGGLSPLAAGDYVLVGYGQRVMPNGGREFGFETPRLSPVTSSPGMAPLPLLRTPDLIGLGSTLEALAVDELALSNSLVSADANNALSWWDLRSTKPWSHVALDAVAVDLCAGRLESATVVYSYGTRIQAIDAELKHWMPGKAQDSDDPRTDWSGGEPIVALAAARDRIFVGNAEGRLFGWDDYGTQRFAIDLFAGPILQLSATTTPLGTVVAAFDSTQSTVCIVDGESGAVILRESGPGLGDGAIAQVVLRPIGNDLALAVLRGAGARLWQILRDPRQPNAPVSLPNDPVCKSPAADQPDAIAVGFEGSKLALFYRADAKIRCVPDGGTAVDAVDSPGANASLDFGQDDANQFLAAAAPNKALRLWQRPIGSAQWNPVTGVSAVPADGGYRLGVSLERKGASWTLAVGPGERLADPLTDRDRVVQVFDAPSGTELVHEPVPHTAPRPALLGPRFATASVPAPHAAVCRDAKSDVPLIDLRSGETRFPLTHNAAVHRARFGETGGRRVLLTAMQQIVTCWDLDSRAKRYEFSDAVDVDALVVDGDYAGVAAGAIRLWHFAGDPTAVSAETIRFGDPAWPARRLAIHVTATGIVVVAATQSTSSSTYRLEIWDASTPLAMAKMRLSWPVAGEIRDVVILDETMFAMSRRVMGQPGVVEILSVSAADQLPVVRWNRTLKADAAVKLTRLVPPGCSPADARLVFDDGMSIGAWALAPRLQIANDRAIDLHLPVQVLDTLAGVGAIGADIVTGSKAYIYLTPDGTPADLRRLHPESAYRDTFGFVAGLATPGTDAGTQAVCLWRNIQGQISGSLVDEVLSNAAATLASSDDPTHPIPNVAADRVELQFTAFNPNAVVTTRKITTLSARLAVTLPQGTLNLDIGEQRPDGDDAHPSEFFAHLTWKMTNSTFELQGPVRVRCSAAATGFQFVTGVYRIQPVQLATADSTDQDVAMPVDGDKLLNLYLAGGEPRDTGPADESLDTFYASLQLTSRGLDIRLVPDIDIPFDPCLDLGIAGVLPSALPNVVQLVHRQVLGPRLRHQPPTPGSVLLTATSMQAAPAHTLLWGIAPIVQDGDQYRMLTSLVFVGSAALASSQGTTLQTENLLLLSRDDTDADELGAIAGLHNVTAATGERFLLDAAAIDERLQGIEAAGAVVQRILRGSGPATLRIIRRISISAPAAAANGRAATVRTLGIGPSLDFRSATPHDACGLRRAFTARYLLDDPSIDADIDASPTAWCRFGIRDVQWPDRPARSAAGADYGFLWSERTAFHRMPQFAALPPRDQVFPASDSLATSFRPQAIDVQMAPDKPGAMFHHAIHAFESPPNAPAGKELPRPRTLVSESVTEFALREPMQLVPPEGTNLAINLVKPTPVGYRQAEQLYVEWKETLGTIAVKAASTTVPLDQLDADKYPAAAEVRVELSADAADRFLQLIVRINDDFYEIDERQAQFPLYDARQSAATAGELDDRTKAFKESANSQDSRPIAPQMDLVVDDLSISSSPAGLWALAVAQFNLRIWRLDASDPSATTLPAPGLYFKTNDSATAFLAEFATHLGQQMVLCNDDGQHFGLFLRGDLLPTPQASVQISSTPVKAICFVSLPSVVQNGNDYSQIQIEAYLACTDSLVQIWYQRSDQTTQVGRIDLQSLDLQEQYFLDAVSVVRTHPSAPKLDHCVLSVAVGVQGKGPITTFEIDFSHSPVAPKRLAAISVDNLTALSSGSLEGTFVVFAGDVQGRVQCFDAGTGNLLKLFAPAAFTVERLTVGEAAGRLVVAVTIKQQSGVPRISIWDVAAGTLLRTTGFSGANDDSAYGVAQAIELAGGVHFLVAQTDGVGRVQLFDPLLTPFRPPECYFVTTVGNNHNPTLLLDPVVLKIQYTSGGVQTSQDVKFEPWLIMTDRNDPSVEYRTNLKSILTDSGMPSANGKYVLTFVPAEQVPPDAQLRWERAGGLRIAWVSDTPIGGRTLEAPFGTPSADKQIKPVPYSAVAPKIAVVVLADDAATPTAHEIWQKTALFGDAATAQGGAPVVLADGSLLAYEATDRETFDLPMTSGTARLKLMLVKYLVNGQTVGTGVDVIP